MSGATLVIRDNDPRRCPQQLQIQLQLPVHFGELSHRGAAKAWGSVSVLTWGEE